MHFRRFACPVGALLFLMLSVSTPAWSQAGTSGTITGTVTDQTGAGIPGATLTLTDLGTNTVRTAKSGSGGVYDFTNLPPASYDLTVTMQGFETFKISNVKLDVAANRRIDAKLSVGSVTQSVTVQATPPVLNTEDASTGQVIGEQSVNELPLNGRDFQQLQLLTPGTISTTNYQTQEGLAGGASVLAVNSTMNVANGGRGGAVLFLIDGAEDTNQNGRSLIYRPSIDEIDQFKEQTADMSAQYGYGSSVVNVSIKSGTNHIHGTVYEFLRNSVTDSRSYFAQYVEPYKQSQFGGTVGGPVIIPKLYNGKDKTFWFLSYEGLQVAQANTEIATVPTALERTGDFSQYPAPIYDPASTTPDPAVPGAYIRTPFPGNKIPADRINPVARFFMADNWIPLPNRPGNSNNFLIEPSVLTSYNQGTIKLDQYIGSTDQISARLSQNYGLNGSIGPYASYSLYDPGAEPAYPTTYSADIDWVHTLNPNNLLDLRGTYARAHSLTTTPNIEKIDYTTQLGIHGFGPGVSNVYPSYPSMNITGYTGLPSGTQYNYISNDYSYSANYTMVRGRHTFQMGETFRDWQQNLTDSGQGSGSFNFTGMYTQDPLNPTTTGSGLADFLLGVPASGSRYIPPGWFYQRMKNEWAYFNDSWKATRNLTVTLGVRYEINWPVTEEHHQFATFSPQARGGRGAIVVPDQQSVSAPYYHTSVPLSWPVYGPLSVYARDVGLSPTYLRSVGYHNFAPRLGVAYMLDPKSVIRAGYGLYYMQLDGNRESETESAPFLIRESGILNDPELPTHTIQTLFPAGSSFSSKASLFGEDPNPTNFGYTEEWNLSIQRAIKQNLSLDVGYVGTAGIHLQATDALNTPRPGPGTVQTRRPYSDFGVISWDEQSAQSIYHSLQASLDRRFSSGFSVLASFTWSKAIDDASDDTETYEDPYNHSLSRGLSSFDIPRNFTLAALYALPALSREARMMRSVLGGWMLSSIVSYHDGFPFTPYASGDPANTGTFSYADVVPGCNPALSGPTPQEWFNTACFVAPPGAPDYGWGNARRNILRGDFYKDYDGGVFKNFQLTEKDRLEVRFEGFNIFNQHSFGLPNATVGAPGYGSVTTASPGRILQGAAKIYF